jgi:hypothetical protein
MSAQIDHDTHVKLLTHVADTISAGAILGTFVGLLPPLAAFVATIWYLVQIWESHTVQKWVRLHLRHRRTYRSLKRHNRLVRQVVQQKAVHRLEPPAL